MNIIRRNFYVRGRLERLRIRLRARMLQFLVVCSPVPLFVSYGSGHFSVLHKFSDFRFLTRTRNPAFSVDVIRFVETRQGATFLDVGANIGLISIVASRRFSTVHAFEPDERCQPLLQLNLEANGVSNVHVHETLVSSSIGVMQFSLGTELGHSTAESRHLTRMRRTSNVEATTIDQFCRNHEIGFVDVMKIDVEGHELEVIEGAVHTLREKRVGQIVFEHSPVLLQLNGRNPAEVFDALAVMGYDICDLEGKSITREEMAYLEQTDLVASPRI